MCVYISIEEINLSQTVSEHASVTVSHLNLL